MERSAKLWEGRKDCNYLYSPVLQSQNLSLPSNVAVVPHSSRPADLDDIRNVSKLETAFSENLVGGLHQPT